METCMSTSVNCSMKFSASWSCFSFIFSNPSYFLSSPVVSPGLMFLDMTLCGCALQWCFHVWSANDSIWFDSFNTSKCSQILLLFMVKPPPALIFKLNCLSITWFDDQLYVLFLFESVNDLVHSFLIYFPCVCVDQVGVFLSLIKNDLELF